MSTPISAITHGTQIRARPDAVDRHDLQLLAAPPPPQIAHYVALITATHRIGWRKRWSPQARELEQALSALAIKPAFEAAVVK